MINLLRELKKNYHELLFASLQNLSTIQTNHQKLCQYLPIVAGLAILLTAITFRQALLAQENRIIEQKTASELIFFIGVFLAIVFSLTIYLGQTVWLRVKQIQEINKNLNRQIKETNLAEQQLRKTTYFVQKITETIPNILYIYNIPNRQYMYVNGALASLGYSATEIKQIEHDNYLQLVHPEDRDKFSLHLLNLDNLENEQILEIEYRLKDSQGGWHWLRCRERVFARSEAGEIEQILGSAEDITLRKQAQDLLKENKLRLRTIVNNITDGLIVVNSEGKILFVNPATEKIFGRLQEELLKELFGFPCVANESTEIAIIQKPGQLLIAEMRVVPMTWFNETAYLVSLRDISDRKKAETALFESEQRLEGIVNSIDDVVWSASPKDFTIQFLNQAVEKVYGRPLEDFFINTKLLYEMLHPEDKHIINEHLEILFKTGFCESDFRIIRPDGEIRWLSGKNRLVFDSEGKAIRIDGVDRDITERKKAQEQLWRYGFYDSLTQLPNRASFLTKLKYRLQKAQHSPNKLFAVLFLDLDDFKLINDSLGHGVGDLLLTAIGSRLKQVLHSADTVARIGGDEFSILLQDIAETAEVVKVVKKIQKALKEPFWLDHHEVFTNVCIGIALSTGNYILPEKMLQDADTAMYRAKSLGKNSYGIFDENMRLDLIIKLQLDTDLRKAIKRREFLVYYQPIISLSTGVLTGFEALIRWQHPERGFISPAEFIPLAEDTGLILPIGKWVLQEACQQLQLWHSQYDNLSLSINVNFSVKQLRQPDILKQIDQVLESTNLSGNFLNIEITESLLLDNVDEIGVMLEQLKSRGIKVSIDDFGTGYSSLSYLHRFPVNTLKIDRSFVKDIGEHGENSEIIQVIFNLAQTLNIEVVAEGIETLTQLEFLKRLGCHKGQGYYIAKPLDKQAAAKLIQEQLQPQAVNQAHE